MNRFLENLDSPLKDFMGIPFFLVAILHLLKEMKSNDIVCLKRGEILRYLVKSRLIAADSDFSERAYLILTNLGAEVNKFPNPDQPIEKKKIYSCFPLLKRFNLPRKMDFIECCERANILSTSKIGRKIHFQAA